MLWKVLVYIILWVSFQLLVYCQITPKQREWHTATFVDKKLYILGGVYLSDTNTKLNEFLYLDFSGPFNTKALSWQNLSDKTVPAHTNAATVVGGANNDTLFLYGGATPDVTMALVYTFDPKSELWSIPNIVGAPPERKYVLTGIIDNTGKMYLWGGYAPATNGNVNDMSILDTISLSWREGSLVGAPSPRYTNGVVLLPNQNIIYMGK